MVPALFERGPDGRYVDYINPACAWALFLPALDFEGHCLGEVPMEPAALAAFMREHKLPMVCWRDGDRWAHVALSDLMALV